MRRTPALRGLVRETTLTPRDLIAPLFVKEGIAEPAEIPSMPGQVQHTLESVRKEVVEIASRGVPAFMLFGIPARKDPEGSEAWNPDGIGQRAIAAVVAELGHDHVVIGDLCLDEYTDHGHCGVLTDAGDVDNDATLDRYRRIAVAQAEAGAQMVGPSGMMDGQVAAIRGALDDAGHTHVGIMAYAAKFASAFYGPFRDAAECAPRFGDRSGYQMDSGQRGRGDARDPRRHRRGRRRRDGEAGAPLPRHHPCGQGPHGLPDGRVPRERGVRDAEGRRVRTAGSTSAARRWNRSRRSGAPAPT